jgi:AcrR family transcriptional regulator
MQPVNEDSPVLDRSKKAKTAKPAAPAKPGKAAAAVPGNGAASVARAKKVAAPVAKRARAPGRGTASETAPATVAAAAPARRKRRNKRSEETISNILAATEQIVLQSGADRISILDVCKAASVSRGTFYRYFASQDELLDAFSRHKRESFHRALTEATAPFDDPDERLDALIDYLEDYLEHGRARRLLVVAPEYALGFFKRIFHDAVVRFEDALRPVFDAWDVQLHTKLDRELVCEMLIRYVMSELLVPGDADRRSLPRRLGRLISSIAGSGIARGRR